MNRYILKIFSLLFFSNFLAAQSPTTIQSEILDGYVKMALESNLALQTQEKDLQKSIIALEQAKTLFLPQVVFQSQYTLAAGGRTLDFPIGDLLNPVYSTLNQLTQTNKFPQVQNQQINFLPNNFHETKLHATYGIYNKDRDYNKLIRTELIEGEKIKADVYKRELVKEVKTVYVKYLQLKKSIELYENALVLLRENVRVNEKLVANNVATKVVVLKAQTEVNKIEEKVTEANVQMLYAGAYFNFLMNRPFDAEILIDKEIVAKNRNLVAVEITANASNREELRQFESGIKANQLQLKMNESYKKPKIGTSLDVGFQGFGFNIFDRQLYGLLGLQLELPVYTAKNNKWKIEQTKIDIQKLELQKTETNRKMELQIYVAKANLYTAQDALKVNEAENAAAQEYLRLIQKKYAAGQALQIELTDAQTQFITAQQKENLARYHILERLAELERTEASAKF